jgi:hypothetical protein
MVKIDDLYMVNEGKGQTKKVNISSRFTSLRTSLFSSPVPCTRLGRTLRPTVEQWCNSTTLLDTTLWKQTTTSCELFNSSSRAFELTCRPLTTLRDALTTPATSSLSPLTIQTLLKYHLKKLKRPWDPYYDAGKTQPLAGQSVTIPSTNLSLPLTESSRKIASTLAERQSTSELDGFLLCESYDRYSLDAAEHAEGDQRRKVERLTLWYAEECLAVPQILVILQHLNSDGLYGLQEVANSILSEVIEDDRSFIESLFRGWGRLAQKSLDARQRPDPGQALFW